MNKKLILFFASCAIALAGLFVAMKPLAQAAGSSQVLASEGVKSVFTVCPDGPPTCDFSVIQDAVDAAAWGDTVQVAAGTYSQINNYGGLAQILYLDKSVTIRGGYTTAFTDPPDPIANPTILDAQGSGRVVYMSNDAAAPVLEGLTMTGGDATGLGGTPYDADAGGGLYLWGGATVISNCVITGNYAPQDGGGIYMRMFSQAQLIRNEVTQNQANYGGGIYVWSSYPLLTENLIADNTANSSGGGVWLGVGSSATFEKNIFLGNSGIAAYNEGAGGMLGERCTLRLDGNIFRENSVGGGGSGLTLIRCDATLINNIFADNQVSEVGGSLCLTGANAQLYHNTFIGTSGGTPSGIYLATHWEPRFSQAVLVNTIIVSETTGIYAESGNFADLEATLWGDGAWANDSDWGGAGNIVTGTINLWGDPAFVDPQSANYHITPGSPAVDAGVDAGIDIDIDGDIRPIGGGYDIGADELLYGLFLAPTQQTGSGLPDEILYYHLELQNWTSLTDVYDLALGQHVWETTLSDSQIGPLGPGEAISFTVSVTISPDADWYDDDSVVITATSQTSPTVYWANAQITTQAYAPPQISLHPLSLESTQTTGQIVTQTLTISNGYGVTLTFDILNPITGSVLMLHLDEPAGSTTFYDSSGNENHGTCSGEACPEAGLPGISGNAIQFNGDDFVTVPNSPELNPQNAISFSAWIFPFDWNTNRRILQKGIWDSQYRFLAEGYEFNVDIYNVGRATTDLPTPGVWHHVVGLYNGNEMQIWIDGQLSAEAPASGQIPITDEPLYIGTKYDGAPPSDFFNGQIDEIAIFDYALTPAEIIALYQMRSAYPWLTVDPISGTVPTDSSIPIQVVFDSTDLQPDTYTATLYVIGNDPLNLVVQVPVTMTVDVLAPHAPPKVIHLPLIIRENALETQEPPEIDSTNPGASLPAAILLVAVGVWLKNLTPSTPPSRWQSLAIKGRGMGG